jgi:anti-sigma B factor antagonist
MAFELHPRQIAGARVISASGDFHLGGATRNFREAVQYELDQGERQILINLARVRSIDSAGVGELVWAQSAARRAGGSVSMVNVPPRIESILRLMRLLLVIDVWPNETSAIHSLSGTAACRAADAPRGGADLRSPVVRKSGERAVGEPAGAGGRDEPALR